MSVSASIGALDLEVVQVSFSGYSSDKVLVRLQLGGDNRSTVARKSKGSSRVGTFGRSRSEKTVLTEFKQHFQFEINHPSDYLSVSCWKIVQGDGHNLCLGRSSIALNHLPVGKLSKKWYQLTGGVKDGATLLQLNIKYGLNYSLTHGKERTITSVPSSSARKDYSSQAIQFESMQSGALRFLDYFLVIGLPASLEIDSQDPSVQVLERYPLTDRTGFPLPDVSLFCFPAGVENSCTPLSPSVFSFRVSTNIIHEACYAVCLTFWEKRDMHICQGDGDISDRDEVSLNSKSSLDETSTTQYVYAPKCICLLSRMPFVPQFRTVATELYNLFWKSSDVSCDDGKTAEYRSSRSESVPENGQPFRLPAFEKALTPAALQNPLEETTLSKDMSLHVFTSIGCCGKERLQDDGLAVERRTVALDYLGRSIEQYVVYLADEVPLPEPGSHPVSFSIGSRTICIRRPADRLDFPQGGDFSLLALFKLLGMQTILFIIRCMLSEMKIIFHSQQLSLLHFVSESLISLCFPFSWSHVYIPVLPVKLSEIVEAPVPFIVGVRSDCLGHIDKLNLKDDVAIVDIDRDSVQCVVPPPDFSDTHILLGALRKLICPPVLHADSLRFDLSLPNSYTDSWTPEKEQIAGRCIRYEFLQFLAVMLDKYRNYLHFIDGALPIFDTPAYLEVVRKRKNSDLPFISRFLQTQLFRDFLDKHVESPSYLHDFIMYANDDRNAHSMITEARHIPGKQGPICCVVIFEQFHLSLSHNIFKRS